MVISLYNYFTFCFRHIETYSSIIQEHTHAYSEPCVYLAYSDPWHILIEKHMQTPRYVHNTILNIITKAPSWTFDIALNALLSCRCFLTSIVFYGVFNVIFEIYTGMRKTYSAMFFLLKSY